MEGIKNSYCAVKMETNSNYRKRRLLEESVSSTIASYNSKRDAATSTICETPMALDTYTQTDLTFKNIDITNIQAKFDIIFDKLETQTKILEEIKNYLHTSALSTSPVISHTSTTTQVLNMERSGSSTSVSNIEYKIIENDQEITIEPIETEIIHGPHGGIPSPVSEYQDSIGKELIIAENENDHTQSKELKVVKIEVPGEYSNELFDMEMKQELHNAREMNRYSIGIGPNKTQVPLHILDSIEWRSSSVATRKLLTAVFNREVLATHTLTGKPSPAFHGRGKPLKNKLDQNKVNDIIYAVSKYCNVPEREVRCAITTKCADENKMLKQRIRRSLSIKDENKENQSHNDTC